MEGIIHNFRMSRHHHYGNQMIVQVEGITDKDKAQALIGKIVVWKSPAGKEIKGEVTSSHGTKGSLRILFEKGMPGQAIATRVIFQ